MNTYQTLALAMLLGSIPFQTIFERRRISAGEKEPRLSGSELVIVGALDMAKVAVPVYLAAVYVNPKIAILACVVGVLSSCFPYWLMFKPQDNGLKPLLGGLIGLNPVAGAFTLAVWAGMLLVSDRFSVAAMTAAIFAPVFLKVFGSPNAYTVFALVACSYVIVAHSENITRLIDGSEPHWKRNE